MDKKIVKRFSEGDADAFDLIYRQYSKKLYQFAKGLVKDQDQAKDLVQEVFINLWEKRESVDLNLNFENYLFTISYNSIRKFFRKRAMETKVMYQLLQKSPKKMEGIDSTLIYNELLDLANQTIENLPPKRKAVYKLSRQEGMRIKEIARKLNISTRTAENHLARALKYLKTELAEDSILTILFFFLFLK